MINIYKCKRFKLRLIGLKAQQLIYHKIKGFVAHKTLCNTVSYKPEPTKQNNLVINPLSTQVPMINQKWVEEEFKHKVCKALFRGMA